MPYVQGGYFREDSVRNYRVPEIVFMCKMSLLKKTKKAVDNINAKTIVFAGGVAANSEIRKKFFALEEEGYKIYAPEMKYCTDNAAMIASCAYFSTNTIDSLDVEVFSRMKNNF